ncbi:hypothetical protein F8M41_007478 [Gigaspora margarita]|uniref:Uncharacterized protein n=1 Tax=Gigaspora margarita TaxID=4874 RepID=A0A8H3X4W2_GIGMA|nr:hypothetical protein F8M41_007478 [Gigaspora margarita]
MLIWFWKMEERHENSLYQRLLHLINSEEERILIKDQLEEIDEVITSINDLQNDLDFDKILDDYRIKSQEVEVQLEENINHEKIDKNSLRDLKYSVDNINTPHPKLPIFYRYKKVDNDRIGSTKRVVYSLVFVFSDETSQVVGTPNTGRLTDFLWVDGEYITELSYIMGKYINGIEIKTNSGRSTGWQGSQSGRKERIVPGFFSNWFSSWQGLF